VRGGEIPLLTLCGEYYTMWRLWAKALGEKNGKSDREADKVAVIRTLIILSYILTNMFIIAGVIRHW
jgi:hypothetical protein